MSAIAHADKILGCFDTGKKIGVMQDMIISTVFQNFNANAAGSVYRINSIYQPVWIRHLFMEPFPAGGEGYGRQCQLSHDGQFLYVVGEGPSPDNFGIPHFYKLNAATGETIWEKETSESSTLLCIDHAGDIIIWRDNGYLLKYDSAGNAVWPSPINYVNVKGIAADSNNNIYLVHGPRVDGYNLQKLNSSGEALSIGYAIHVDNGSSAYAVVIDENDNIFIVGSPNEVSPGVFHNLFKLNTSCELIASVPVGPVGTIRICRHVTLDSIGNVFALDDAAYIHKYSAAMVSQWDYHDGANAVYSKILCDVQNRIHMIDTPDTHESVRDKDGNLDLDVFMVGSFGENIIFAKEVFIGHYTDQPTILFREDMVSFMDDTIPEFVTADFTRDVGDLVWEDNVTQVRPEPTTGIFKNLIANNGVDEPGFRNAWRQLNWVPSSDPPNNNWDAYEDAAGNPFGGIGNCPLIYTVSFYGMKKVSDDSPSPYNGEHLIIRGPGYYGFFFGVNHDIGTRINFTVHEESDSDDKEKLHFGTDALPTCMFKYETASNNNEKLTDVQNENIKTTPDAIAYDGTASMYPGKRARWDATTIWAVDHVVAWEGRFYKAVNQNSNSEPPSGDWTVL